MELITYRPTAKDIADYLGRGFWISPKLISDDHIVRLRQASERLFAGKIDGHGSLYDGALKGPEDPLTMKRAVNAWWVNDEVRKIVFDPGLGRIASALMGVDRVRFWADQVIIKPGTNGTGTSKSSNIGWHQDAAYWHITSTHPNMVTAWIALQDTDLSNGGMRTLVGSHKWGLIPDSDQFYDPNLDNQRSYFEKKGLGPWIDEPCNLKAGQVSFHHSLCFHGSAENKTSTPRFSVIGHYTPDGAVFTPTGKYSVFLRLLGPKPNAGMRFTEPVFPMVYPQE